MAETLKGLRPIADSISLNDHNFEIIPEASQIGETRRVFEICRRAFTD